LIVCRRRRGRVTKAANVGTYERVETDPSEETTLGEASAAFCQREWLALSAGEAASCSRRIVQASSPRKSTTERGWPIYAFGDAFRYGSDRYRWFITSLFVAKARSWRPLVQVSRQPVVLVGNSSQLGTQRASWRLPSMSEPLPILI
jgi:hypothetical protein